MAESGISTEGLNADSFEKQLEELDRATKYIDKDLRKRGQEGLTDAGDYAADRDAAEEEDTRLKNERFARSMSRYRVQYDYE